MQKDVLFLLFYAFLMLVREQKREREEDRFIFMQTIDFLRFQASMRTDIPPDVER